MNMFFCHTTALLLGVILDLIIGDPKWFPHPVRLMGKAISFISERSIKDDKRNGIKEKRSGLIMCVIMTVITGAAVLAITVAAYNLNLYIGIFVEAILTCLCLAAKSLCKESMAVYTDLKKTDTVAARKSLSMIVGRDTDGLSEEGIIKAAVETVSENASDGVIAPLLYTMLFGPVGGFIYKAINTMDSMVGYKNERYRNFGYCPARLDDIANFVPARLTGMFMVLSAYILGLFKKEYDGKNAWDIFKNDRKKHDSPNSAHGESACAGALGIELAGPASYGGVFKKKPYIGVKKRAAEAEDIKRANALMFMTEGLMVCAYILIALIILLWK